MKFNKYDLGRWLMIIGVSFIVFFFAWVTMPGHYINRPFSECQENVTQTYGAIESCGELMNESTAKLGLFLILIGLPVLAFVVMPLIVSLKKESKK